MGHADGNTSLLVAPLPCPASVRVDQWAPGIASIPEGDSVRRRMLAPQRTGSGSPRNPVAWVRAAKRDRPLQSAERIARAMAQALAGGVRKRRARPHPPAERPRRRSRAAIAP